MTDIRPLAYFWGEDAWSIERAARDYRAALEAGAGSAMDVWRAPTGDEDADSEVAPSDSAGRRRARVLDEIAQRLSTATLFGGGTLVIVRQPGWLLKEAASRERLHKMLDEVAPGNAMAFVDLLAQGGKPTVQGTELRDAVQARKGEVKDFAALSKERMEGWIISRAKELEVTLGPGAPRLLAERVGAFVREGDVDRRRMSELANAELEKLALYRPGGTVTQTDIDDLVPEAVPGSTWAFLDAIGYRRAGEAATLADKLLKDATPIQVMVTQIHRRLRELVTVRDHMAAGTKPQDLVRELKVQPFRAQKLSEQAATWAQEELDEGLADLYQMDLISKGIAEDGSPRSLSDDKSQLALLSWIGAHANRRRTVGVGVGPGSEVRGRS